MDELIKRAQRGDREALTSLVREYYAPVYRFCARRLGSDSGQDAAQETFVTMQKSVARYQFKSCFQTWLLGIAHNHCRNIARKNRMESVPLEHWMSPQEGHENSVVNHQQLLTALKRLSEEHRQVVLMHEIEELRYSEIAEILGVPEGTVKSRLHHAFLKLRETMSEVRS